MEAVTIGRELWRRRTLVGLAAVAAVLVGLMFTYTFSLPPESRKHEVGTATGRILVDTPDSQVVDVAPRGSETLGARASLLANLMTEGEVKKAIARRADLSPDELVAGVESATPSTVLMDASRDPEAHLLVTRLVTNAAGEPLPIIEIEAQAPDAERAALIASSAVSGLRSYLDSKAVTEQVPDARRLEVAGLGAPQAVEEVRGPRLLVAFAVALFVFLVGCTGILVGSALARGWRPAFARDAPRALDHDRGVSDARFDDGGSIRSAEKRLVVVSDPPAVEEAAVSAGGPDPTAAEVRARRPAARTKRSAAGTKRSAAGTQRSAAGTQRSAAGTKRSPARTKRSPARTKRSGSSAANPTESADRRAPESG
jgi:hypothetical protein